MHPVYLIHWGDPRFEVPELPKISKSWWKSGNKINHCSIFISSNNPEALFLQIIIALCDEDCQVIYLSCHGLEDGFSFTGGESCDITYTEFKKKLNEFPAVERGPVSVIFGSCEAMSDSINIQNGLPEWIFEVAGFVDKPAPRQVAQLTVELLQHTIDYFREISKHMADAAIGTKSTSTDVGQQIDAKFKAMKKAFDKADASYKPLSGVKVKGSGKDVVIKKRKTGTDDWERIEYIQVDASKKNHL